MLTGTVAGLGTRPTRMRQIAATHEDEDGDEDDARAHHLRSEIVRGKAYRSLREKLMTSGSHAFTEDLGDLHYGT
jgi:hypothetical protein